MELLLNAETEARQSLIEKILEMNLAVIDPLDELRYAAKKNMISLRFVENVRVPNVKRREASS